MRYTFRDREISSATNDFYHIFRTMKRIAFCNFLHQLFRHIFLNPGFDVVGNYIIVQILEHEVVVAGDTLVGQMDHCAVAAGSSIGIP